MTRQCFDWLPEPEEPAQLDVLERIADDVGRHREGYGRRLRDYDRGMWSEVSALHRDGSHDLADRVAERGSLKPMKPAMTLGSALRLVGMFNPPGAHTA